ncbi:MAG: SIMPL domain-containing protein [Gammaproteobacteria bacterium]|nr:SIMPL domain-containing protein [Gammaproteobacteria bacterium]MDH5654142.1 SIMPL domain-containing protein [Gammaproteobacteria bacterium]
MKYRLILFLNFLVFVSNVCAEPNMQGTPSELDAYLNKVPKTVYITANAREKINAGAAVVKLMVLTENKHLATAMADNSKVRQEIRKQCTVAGIKDKDISDAKFSSTPEYGWFGDKPSSYKVENMMSVRITNEAQLIKIAAIADTNPKVHFISNLPEVEDEDKIRRSLLAKALKTAQTKAKVYADELGLKLLPVSFSEEGVIAQSPMPVQRRMKYRMSSSEADMAPESAPAQFGQSEYHMSVTVVYQVKSK